MTEFGERVLMDKLLRLIPSQKLTCIIDYLIADISFEVHTRSTASCKQKINDSMLQGSVLAPVLFVRDLA